MDIWVISTFWLLEIMLQWIFAYNFLCDYVCDIHIQLFVCAISTLLGMYLSFPSSSDHKVSACDARDPGLIPGSGRSSGEGNGNPEKSHGQRSLVGYSPWGGKESDTTEWLNNNIVKRGWDHFAYKFQLHIS